MTNLSRPSPAGSGAAEHCPDAEARDVTDGPARKRVNAIIDRCATRHSVSVADILGHSRRREIVAARWEAIGLVAKVFPEFSTPHLGEIFNRDHTAILYALGRITKPKKGAPQ